MKSLITFLVLTLGLSAAHAELPDLTGNYTGCGTHSASGNQQMVLILVKIRTGFGENDFKYTGGFYLKTNSAQVATDFFSDVKIDPATLRILMLAEIKPVRDFGMIAKSLEAKINPDGSITGSLLTNASGSHGGYQSSVFTVRKVDGEIKPLKCP